jgi:hypothetical protein
MEFNIFFLGDAPAHNPLLPAGGGALIGDTFSPIIFLDNTPPLFGQIFELGDDHLLHNGPLLNIFFAGYYSSESGNLGSAYSLENTLQLDDSQRQNLLAGNWYAEVEVDQKIYFGRFTPVPEPAGPTLLAGGVALILAGRVSRRFTKVSGGTTRTSLNGRFSCQADIQA